VGRPRSGPGFALSIVAFACTACGGGSGDLGSPDIDRALARITADEIAAHMAVLADDAMQGRGTGTEGHLLAAEYVAGQLETLGLDPAGGADGYYQQVPLLATSLDVEQSSLTLIRDGARRPLEPLVDYVMDGDPFRERAEVTAPLVFVGYGVRAPEHGHDDYAGVDVEGKIVVLFRGAPASFPHDERAYHASRTLKKRIAAEQGAVGILRVMRPQQRERVSWDGIAAHAGRDSMRWAEPDGAPFEAWPELLLYGTLSPSGEQRLFEGAEHSFDDVVAAAEESRPLSFDLPGRIEARTSSSQTRLDSPNVVAVLPGSDPELAGEYVVITAHLDHVGVGAPRDGDGIYNGAYDNASGTAILLEIAAAFAALPEPPRRSVLFLAVTGEEKGLLGSDYFARFPTVPREGLIANVNLDMVMMLYPLLDVVAYGAEHSTIEEPIARAASRLDLRLSPDPTPEEVLFIRSDQYSFVRQGVPSVFIVSGFETADPEIDGREKMMEWIRTTYHEPGDDMDQDFDFGAGERFARLNFLVAYQLAQDEERPTWHPGDFFGERFGGG
jgi:Zn-dependent M28 family amino/carboxypeptidase